MKAAWAPKRPRSDRGTRLRGAWELVAADHRLVGPYRNTVIPGSKVDDDDRLTIKPRPNPLPDSLVWHRGRPIRRRPRHGDRPATPGHRPWSIIPTAARTRARTSAGAAETPVSQSRWARPVTPTTTRSPRAFRVPRDRADQPQLLAHPSGARLRSRRLHPSAGADDPQVRWQAPSAGNLTAPGPGGPGCTQTRSRARSSRRPSRCGEAVTRVVPRETPTARR